MSRVSFKEIFDNNKHFSWFKYKFLIELFKCFLVDLWNGDDINGDWEFLGLTMGNLTPKVYYI